MFCSFEHKLGSSEVLAQPRSRWTVSSLSCHLKRVHVNLLFLIYMFKISQLELFFNAVLYNLLHPFCFFYLLLVFRCLFFGFDWLCFYVIWWGRWKGHVEALQDIHIPCETCMRFMIWFGMLGRGTGPSIKQKENKHWTKRQHVERSNLLWWGKKPNNHISCTYYLNFIQEYNKWTEVTENRINVWT